VLKNIANFFSHFFLTFWEAPEWGVMKIAKLRAIRSKWRRASVRSKIAQSISGILWRWLLRNGLMRYGTCAVVVGQLPPCGQRIGNESRTWPKRAFPVRKTASMLNFLACNIELRGVELVWQVWESAALSMPMTPASRQRIADSIDELDLMWENTWHSCNFGPFILFVH